MQIRRWLIRSVLFERYLYKKNGQKTAGVAENWIGTRVNQIKVARRETGFFFSSCFEAQRVSCSVNCNSL